MADYDIGEAFKAIEDELIASMIRNMDGHRAEETKEGIQWSMWQAEQLKALDKYKRENQKRYGKQFKDINGQIEALIRQSRDTGNMQQEIQILDAIRKGFFAQKVSQGGSAEFFRLNDRKLESLIEATTHDMQQAETAVLRMANDQYRKAIFNAQVYANTGAGTYEKAVDMATKDMLSRGLTCIEYANGARHTLADYADMAIRTASKRAYLQGEGEKRQEWGISTVIMAKRGNPCPKCLPFVGKVLIDDVWSGGKKSDGPYSLMSAAIAAGLYHPRCKDSHTTYFPGISTADDTWTDDELEAVEKDSKQEARQQFAARQAEKYERLSKYSLDAGNKSKYAKKATEWIRAAKMPDFLHIKNWDKMDLQTMSKLNNELAVIPISHQDFLERSGVSIEISDFDNSYYDPRDRIIRVTKDFQPYEVVHEVAHALEDLGGVWEDPEFRKLIEPIGKAHQINDIFDDAYTFSKPIRRINDPRFVSEYQGRVYPGFGETTPDGFVNPDALWDYFSEGYRCFFEEPELLWEKDPDLYKYIRRLSDG